MKRNIIFIIVILLMTTACTCEYNLTIEDSKFKENIKLTAENNDEASSLNNEWKIPVSKNEYNIGSDNSSTNESTGEKYDYKLNGNDLNFTYDFSTSAYQESTAPSLCYEKVTVSGTIQGNMVISTGQKAICFDKYPMLTSILVNITVDEEVISNNADSVNGNTYTWNLNRDNANNKPINLVYKSSNAGLIEPPSENDSGNQESDKKDYSMYIFLGILLLLFLIGYGIYKILSKDNESIE